MRYKNKSGRLWLLLAAITIMAAGFSMVTYAEEAIRTVSVTVTSSVEAEADEGTVSATSNSSKYRVVSCDFANSRGSWKAGETPKVNIMLEAEEGYYFNSINAGKATVKGAVYSSAKKGTDNHSLILSVKLKGVKGTLGTVESAYWESTPLGKARWSKVENAPAYEVKLYCGDRMVYRVEKTSSTNYDFFSHMTTRGDYYFKVRAVAKTESEADYLKAGEWTESDNQEITKQDAIDVLQGKINDLISAESVNQQKRNNEFSDAQENYNSAVSSGNYSVQAAQNEAAIARQKLQDYYAQRDAAQNDVQDKIPDEEKFSDSSEFDDPGNTDDFGNTDDPENSDDSGNTDRTDDEGNKNTSGNGDNSNAQDNSQEQALIDDIRAKEEAVNEAMLSRRRELQSAEQAIRDTQIGDASDSTLENTQAELETAQKDLETLQKVLARKGKVKAPCDGVIKSLSAVTGSQTGAEAAVVLYETKGTFRFQAEVSKDDLKYIKSGGEVILKGADEKEITGAKVESVKEDSSNENQYILSVQVPEGTLSIGDTAEFTISQDAGPFNVCVPLSALYEENGRYYVYVTDTQNTVLGEVLVARKTYVNVKDKNSSTAALENGDLSSDQKIVTSSDREISSGSRIRLLEE